jgi:transcription-repair coupling factor (superfamily II helicase)
MSGNGQERWAPDVPEDVLHALEASLAVVAPPGAIGVLLAALARREDRWLVVVPGQRDLERLQRELGAWTDAAAPFPASEVMPHERLSPRAETVATRLSALHRWRTGDARLLLAPALATIQHLVPGSAEVEPIVLRTGMEVDLDELVERLVALDYRRGDLVERRGEFAVRGGLLDVFPPMIDHPVRLELFGDEVERLRTFAVASQRSLVAIDEVEVWPCRELLATVQVRDRARDAIATHPEDQLELTRLAEGHTFDGMEALLEIVHDEPPVLRDLVPDARILIVEPRLTIERLDEAQREATELKRVAWEQSAEGKRPPAAGSYADTFRALGDLDACTRIATTRAREDEIVLDARPWEHPGDLAKVATQLTDVLRAGTPIVACAPNDTEAERIRAALTAAELPVTAGDPVSGSIAMRIAPLDEGFRAPWLALVAEHDLFGKRRAHRTRRKAAGGYAVPLDLADGDLVVHAVHGIGRYRGMVTREIGEHVNDYLVLEYSNNDKLFVAADQADALSKYIGGEQPTLSRLGGSEWGKQKAKARKAVEDMAEELMALYAQRAQAQGHAFPPDAPWQAELEDAFPYVETPDQLGAIDDVKADMERQMPMDRLVCGDVGFGKTEIAIRAAFKAVQDGKQVAVLVPTTLLAQQHHQTFSERFAPFPVSVAALSRFLSTAQKARILDDLAAGRIDVIIGTHALLQRSVHFADLGLLVVDEEQRFGVKHKERIKQMRANVDVLTMSATPIPRTLEMAMSGIRDMSVIDTPPEDRHPVLTFVDEYDPAIVIRAIERELLRDGQVFYVHNTVHDIDAIASWVTEKVPGARVSVVHGQMEESRLEQVMLDVWERKIDVLVATTIIESGLDIPTANTLVVDRADRLGLAQLYQLRGRVGRSRERAFAYFLYPGGRQLTGDAQDRLQAIGRFTELGSGLQVAIRDLEIRGAGNLLGAQQSGHIANVGFDLYMRMLSEAIEEAKGHVVEHRPEVKIDLPIDVHLPAEWIAREALRLEAYRRVADAPSITALNGVREELLDRYGPFPEQAERLFLLADLRITVGRRGAKLLAYANDRLKIDPFVLADSEQVRFQRLFPKGIYKVDSYEALIPVPRMPPSHVALWTKEMLTELLDDEEPTVGSPDA